MCVHPPVHMCTSDSLPVPPFLLMLFSSRLSTGFTIEGLAPCSTTPDMLECVAVVLVCYSRTGWLARGVATPRAMYHRLLFALQQQQQQQQYS